MEGVVLEILFAIIVIALGTIVYAYYEVGQLSATQQTEALIAYHEAQEFNNLTQATNFSCTTTLSSFEILSSGIVSFSAPVSYKKAVTYTGGIPNQNTIYYASGKFFVLSPYPIVAGNYTNTKICIIPSASNPVFTFE